MKPGLLSLMLMMLAGSATAGDSGSAETSVGFSLQPATGQPLRSVPGQTVYRPIWNETDPSAPLTLTSYTQSEVTEPAVADTVTTDTLKATTANDVSNGIPPTKPFLNFPNEAEQEPQTSTAADGTNAMFLRLAVWTVVATVNVFGRNPFRVTFTSTRRI